MQNGLNLFNILPNKRENVYQETIVSDIHSLFYCRSVQSVATKVCLLSHYKCADLSHNTLYDINTIEVHIMEFNGTE
jgi:hypothetical protein